MSFISLLTSFCTITRKSLGTEESTEDEYGVQEQVNTEIGKNIKCGIDLVSLSEHELYKAHLGGDTKAQLLRVFFLPNVDVESGDIIKVQQGEIIEESSSSDSYSGSESSVSEDSSSSEDVQIVPWSDGIIEVLTDSVVTVKRHHVEAICKYTKTL